MSTMPLSELEYIKENEDYLRSLSLREDIAMKAENTYLEAVEKTKDMAQCIQDKQTELNAQQEEYD